MKVNEIKSGYVLKLRCGNLVGVYESEDVGLCVSGEEDWFPLECLTDTLEYNAPSLFLFHKYPKYDVVEVYGRTNPRCASKVSTEDRELLWTRGEGVEEEPTKCKCECGCEECCEEKTEVTAREAAEATAEIVDAMMEEGFSKSEAMVFLASLIVGGMAMGIKPTED